jgi:alkanesulfonate monooxygenase SsuD/methylene tetrahydromethanopterin reductase-like flavin-dependent oxidoreductase (luciferase family)
MPYQRPIPIWFGGHVEAVLQRVGAIGDGWMPYPLPFEELRQAIERIHGRDIPFTHFLYWS